MKNREQQGISLKALLLTFDILNQLEFLEGDFNYCSQVLPDFAIKRDMNKVLLMEEILHHLAYLKPCKQWDIYHINWCRISSINRTSLKLTAKAPFQMDGWNTRRL